MTELKLNIQTIDARQGDYDAELTRLRQQLSPSGNVVSPRGKALTERVFGQALLPSQVVERICTEVREQGRQALEHYSRELDGADCPTPLSLPTERLEEAHRQAAPEFLQCVRRIRQNILEFQQAIVHHDVSVQPRPGVRLDQRYVPLARVGVCVPGGAAAYPSTVLMTVVPAQAAGVQEIAVVAPPTPFGTHNTEVLATCFELGIREVYPIGGAQAVAALAYGIEDLPAVDKIVGPGNLFVALAKKLVYGDVDIDSIAGPSEVVVIADAQTQPAHTASDMLAQAEHSPGASILVTWDPDLPARVVSALQQQLATLSRHELALDSLNEFGAFVLVRDAEQACQLTDDIAPEHLHIACDDARSLATQIRNAGATFIGPFSPVALGDYAAGPSHVLPTGGTARWAAGLSANSFLRSGSLIEFSQDALRDIADDVGQLADIEGLTAHRRSVEVRLE